MYLKRTWWKGREWAVRRGHRRDQNSWATLITVLCKSLCGFNGFSITAGVNSAVYRTCIRLFLNRHDHAYRKVSVCPAASYRSMHHKPSVNWAHCNIPHVLILLLLFSSEAKADYWKLNQIWKKFRRLSDWLLGLKQMFIIIKCLKKPLECETTK